MTLGLACKNVQDADTYKSVTMADCLGYCYGGNSNLLALLRPEKHVSAALAGIKKKGHAVDKRVGSRSVAN